MKTTVIYHSADFDGLFCREIARKFLPPDTVFVGWNHGDPLLEFPNEGTVYVLDLNPQCFGSLPQGWIERTLWIDHHRTAIESYKNAGIPGYRIDGVSAARLCWQYFTHPASPFNIKNENRTANAR